MHKNSQNELSAGLSQDFTAESNEFSSLSKKKFVKPEISSPLDVLDTTAFFFMAGTPVTDTGDV
jgi:hypothetical protein